MRAPRLAAAAVGMRRRRGSIRVRDARSRHHVAARTDRDASRRRSTRPPAPAAAPASRLRASQDLRRGASASFSGARAARLREPLHRRRRWPPSLRGRVRPRDAASASPAPVARPPLVTVPRRPVRRRPPRKPPPSAFSEAIERCARRPSLIGVELRRRGLLVLSAPELILQRASASLGGRRLGVGLGDRGQPTPDRRARRGERGGPEVPPAASRSAALDRLELRGGGDLLVRALEGYLEHDENRGGKGQRRGKAVRETSGRRGRRVI